MKNHVARFFGCVLLGCACFVSSYGAEPFNGTALVRHAPTLNGRIDGSVQQLTAESVTLNSGAIITSSLFLPGLPAIQINGTPVYGGTLEGAGSAAPNNHRVTLNGGSSLGNVVRRTDPVNLPTVTPPSAPTGTRNVSLNNSGQSPGSFSTLRNLTLNSNVGPVIVPPGTYGDFTANSGSGFVLGTAGTNEPEVYDFQRLTLNSGSTFTVVGPVVLTVNFGFSTNASMGVVDHPEWLLLRIVGNGFTLNGNIAVHALLETPAGALVINGGGLFVGAVAADGLTLNSGGQLRLISPVTGGPSTPDADHDGMDDAWEVAHGLNPQLDDSNLDNDSDGLSNLEEFQRGLSPTSPDTDNDGLYDGDEIVLGRDPKIASPDVIPPAAPTVLTPGLVASDRITLSWPAAIDDLKVSGYIVYRDGQPIETEAPIRDTTYTDANLPDGEEFAYQVRAFDYAGNLSAPGPEILVTTVATDTDGDGLPDEWESKYFLDEEAAPSADADGDGRTNLQEFQDGTDPKDFFNGVKPVLEPLNGGEPGPNDEVGMIVKRLDGTPWPYAPVTFTIDRGSRRISPAPGGPDYFYQLKVLADGAGIARVYLEALTP